MFIPCNCLSRTDIDWSWLDSDMDVCSLVDSHLIQKFIPMLSCSLILWFTKIPILGCLCLLGKKHDIDYLIDIGIHVIATCNRTSSDLAFCSIYPYVIIWVRIRLRFATRLGLLSLGGGIFLWRSESSFTVSNSPIYSRSLTCLIHVSCVSLHVGHGHQGFVSIFCCWMLMV